MPPDAGQAITFPFPAKSPVVVQLTGIGAARERLSATLKAALPDDSAAVDKQIDDGLKELFADRKLTAIPKDGRVYLVVNDLEGLFEKTPAVSLLVPVTSYKEFRETFLTADERKTFEAGTNVDDVKLSLFGAEVPMHMVDLKEYVALTPDKGTADIYAGKFDKATTASMKSELARSFVGADLSLYVNLDVINAQYGEQIKGFKMLADFGIQQALAGGMIPGLGKKQIEVIKVMIGGLFQAIEDCRGLVVAVEFRPEGLNLRVQAQFADDTASVKLLKAESPGPLAEVGKLPAGLGSYSGSKVGQKFVQTMRGLNPEFAAAEDDEKGTEAIEKQLAALAASEAQGEVSASGTPDSSLTVAKYAKPKEAVAALAGCYEAMSAGGRVSTAVLKDAPKVTKDARKHAGFTFSEVKLAFDFEATVKELPDGAKEAALVQLKRSMSEKTTVWVGTDGKTVLQVTAKDWAAATAAIDGYLDAKKPVGDTAGFKLTRKNLPADASVLIMVETGHTITVMLDSLRALEDVVPDFPKIGKVPPLKGKPSFIGLAVTLKGDTATVNAFVPGAAVAAGRKVVADLLKKIDRPCPNRHDHR